MSDSNPTNSPPLVSVVVACVNGLPYIAECCEHLLKQEGNVTGEIIVVDCCGEVVRTALRERFPTVRVIGVEERLSIPKLRAIGMGQA
ncbi:MAG TPA: hypothetical protein VIL86_12365, partial [Tepidisphaeraceae bacterium]